MHIDGSVITVKGTKGELHQTMHPHVQVTEEDGTLHVGVQDPDIKQDRALWGLWRALIQNMVTGVTEGFTKRLEVNGVGFKASLSGKKLVLNLGFSHPVAFAIPEGITAQVEGNVITVSGIDKALVGETAASLRALKKPEPYKGKGIKYADETIRRKAGKVVKAAGG